MSLTMIRRPLGLLPEGSTVTLRGRVKPGRAGVVVQRQVSWSGVTWQNRERSVTDAGGFYRFEVPDVGPAGRTYRWRVAIVVDGRVIAVSPSRVGTIR